MMFKFLMAALGAAFLLVSHPTFAQSKSETYKDIIEKAYNLSLQRDRQQALNILTSAIIRETRPQAQGELKKAALDVSHVFFSDKAQQLFETSASLRKTDLTQAIAKLNEAQRIEPDNISIVIEISRLLIAKGDCSGAQELLTKFIKLIAFDEELKLTNAQAQVCQSQWYEYLKIYDPKEVAKSTLQKFWLANEVEHQVKVKNTLKAQESLGILKKLDSKYPEVAYWSWKVTQGIKPGNLDEAQKYVMTCKNISASQYRQYMIDPMLCRRVVEVEGEIKGMNTNVE
ncbi:MAG: tetratricopeptide repeat protein [Bdellovibrio sp.]